MSAMHWQVKKSGRIMAQGDASTFPSPAERKSMEKAGYKVYVDGKLFNRKDLGLGMRTPVHLIDELETARKERNK